MGIYGLVIQRGPWKRTRQDAAQEAPNKRRVFGGGILGGLDHPGHAGAFTAMTPQTMSVEKGYFQVPRPGPYAHPSIVTHGRIRQAKGVTGRKQTHLESLEAAIKKLTRAIDESGLNRKAPGYPQDGDSSGPTPPGGVPSGGYTLPYEPGSFPSSDVKSEKPTAEMPSFDRMELKIETQVIHQENQLSSRPAGIHSAPILPPTAAETATRSHIYPTMRPMEKGHSAGKEEPSVVIAPDLSGHPFHEFKQDSGALAQERLSHGISPTTPEAAALDQESTVRTLTPDEDSEAHSSPSLANIGLEYLKNLFPGKSQEAQSQQIAENEGSREAAADENLEGPSIPEPS